MFLGKVFKIFRAVITEDSCKNFVRQQLRDEFSEDCATLEFSYRKLNNQESIKLLNIGTQATVFS